MRRIALALGAALTVGLATTALGQSQGMFRLLVLEQKQVRWQGERAGEPVEVTYAFVGAAVAFDSARNCSAMVPVDGLLEKSGIDRPSFQAEVTEAFALWEAAANIRFRRIDDWRSAGILIGAQARPQGFAFANVARDASSSTGAIERSLVCLNPERRWKIGFDGDLSVLDVRYTMAHEIGHAIGLDHPSTHGQLMSFRYEEKFRGLQAGDLEGAALIYGPPSGAPVVAQRRGEQSTLAITPGEGKAAKGPRSRAAKP